MRKAVLTLIASLAASGTVFAAGERTYEVTVTNITAGQAFTPIIAATHSSSIGFFELGQPASAELDTRSAPGRVLSGLVRRIDAEIETIAADGQEAIESLRAEAEAGRSDG